MLISLLTFYPVLGPELARHAREATDVVRRYCKLVSNLDSFGYLDLPQPPTTSPISDSTSHSSTMDADMLRARGKLERALERLRRAGLRVLDAPQIQNKDSRHAATSLLEVIAATLEGSLTQVNPPFLSCRPLICKPSPRTELALGNVAKRRAR